MVLALPGNQSPFAPSSPFAASITRLFNITLVVCAIIGVGVTAVIIYELFAFRARPEGPEPPQHTGQRTIEVAWTIVPLAIVTWLFILAVETMGKSDPAAHRAPDVFIVGHQWWWEVRYPSGVVTANEIHIPAGQPILVRLEAADVVHDFWVPQLGRKMDAVPGHPNFFWMSADTPGSYGGACNEFCGAQHAWMRLLVVAQDPAAFAQWQTAQAAPAPAPAGDGAARGEQLFSSQACGNCHAINGRGFRGTAAPDLTHVASRTTLGAGVTDNSPEHLRAWIHDPQSIKPASHMPNFNLTDAQIDDVLAYLEALR